MEYMEIIQCIVVWVIKLSRYFCLHMAIASIVDMIVFDPLIQWVKNGLVGVDIEDGDIDDRPGDMGGE